MALPYMRGRAAAPSATISGGSAVMNSGTYPRATILSDGSLLGVSTNVANGVNTINVYKSTDSGASWQIQGTVDSGVGDIDNGYLLQLTSGRILCTFRNHSIDPSTGAYTYFRITVCYSDDGGATWTYLSQPASDPGPVNGNWEPFLRLSSLDSNTIQLYYSRENSALDQDSLMRTSADGGSTWSNAATISGENLQSRDGMLGVANLPAGGGNLIAIFESFDTSSGTIGLDTVHSVTSSDDGVTWGNRALVYSPTGTDNNAGAPQIINVGGTMVASFMTDEDTSEHNWSSGADTKVITSTDGVNWGNKATVFDVQSNWPGMVVLDDSNFLCMAEYSGSKSQHMALASS